VVSDQSFKTIRIPSRPQMLRAQPPEGSMGSDLKGLLPKSIMQKFILNTRPTSKSENQLL
jgi:hypothetical protein